MLADGICPKGIVTCVDYADLLALTLPSNMEHMAECLVITASRDTETQRLCASIPGVKLYVTDDFFKDGASFNKGRCIEAGFDVIGRDGWILIWDADIMFPHPNEIPKPLVQLQPDILYGAPRRIVQNPLKWDPAAPWNVFPRRNDNKRVIGYFQLFNAASRFLRDRRPWYDQTFTHAGGGDGYFESLTPRQHQCLLPFDVLHLGPCDANWFGRSTPRLDGSVPERSAELQALMHRYHRFKGWCGYRPSGEAFVERISSDDVTATGHECL